MISKQCAHHARPGSAKNQVTLARTSDFLAVFVQQHWLNAKEWKCLQAKVTKYFLLFTDYFLCRISQIIYDYLLLHVTQNTQIYINSKKHTKLLAKQFNLIKSAKGDNKWEYATCSTAATDTLPNFYDARGSFYLRALLSN